MLCQFLEAEGQRTIRWDLKSRASLDPMDLREIEAYLRQRGLLNRFLQEQQESKRIKVDAAILISYGTVGVTGGGSTGGGSGLVGFTSSPELVVGVVTAKYTPTPRPATASAAMRSPFPDVNVVAAGAAPGALTSHVCTCFIEETLTAGGTAEGSITLPITATVLPKKDSRIVVPCNR